MAMELKLVPKLSQQLVMTPQLKMAIKLLTLNHLELQDAVAAELVENPVLEETYDDLGKAQVGDASADGGSQVEGPAERQSDNAKEVVMESVGTDSQKDNAQEIDWEAYADSYSHLPASAGSGRDTNYDDMPGYDQTLTVAETLEEHLVWQVRMSSLNPLECEIALRLIGEMNDEGFLDRGPLRSPPEIVATDSDPEKKKVENGAAGELLADGPSDADALLGDGPVVGHDDREPPLLADTATPKDLAEVEALLLDGSAEGDAIGELLSDGPENQSDLLQDAAPELEVDPIQMVADELEVPIEWVENVRKKLQRFDPVGCLSRDLRDCLLTQLEIWGYDDECLVFNIVDKHMEDVEKRNYQQIARAFKVPLAEVGDALKILEQLEPRPARNYLPKGVSADAQYITPDVYVTKVGDEYVTNLNEDGLPKLKVSQFYLDKLRSAQRGDPSKSYIKDKMRSATWLIRSIHQRQRTIHKVVDSILKYQRDWFDGTGPLRPLILKEVADDIEMHESTVSRVTTRKYLHCHRGIYELKYFFNSSIQTRDGASIASESVKDEIKRIVSEENPKKPFSDAAIVKMLKERNIEIARRTVAKYREVLGILPSNKRKQVF